MEGVAYHEGNPVHHMQVSYATGIESVPKFRTQMGINALVEGWHSTPKAWPKKWAVSNPLYDFGRLSISGQRIRTRS